MKKILDKNHQRMRILNTTVFGCLIFKEAYNGDMPFRYCPSCGKLVNETETQIKRLLNK